MVEKAEEIYFDMKILGDTDDGYLVEISKAELNHLVTLMEGLVIRHWNGKKPVVLEAYGDDAVRTQEDASEANNLAVLPDIDLSDLLVWLNSQ